jgi:hypothetical protein
MNNQLTLDQTLVQEAQQLGQHETETDAIITALQ